METLKEDLKSNKARLEELEIKLREQIEKLNSTSEKFTEIEKAVETIEKANGSQIVTFNVSGTIYQTRLKTLLSVKDTFFYNLIYSKAIDMTKVLNFDRNPKFFLMVLDFLRYKKCDVKRLGKEDKINLRFEAEYFEVTPLCELLGELNAELAIVNYEYSGEYSFNNQVAGGGRIEDLSDRSMQKGICAKSPGWITFEFNDEFEVAEIEVGGYAGNKSLWASSNGEGATIQTSTDGVTWVTVGSIPSGFGEAIVNVKITRSWAKWIKFTTTTYLGIGYLKVRTISN